MMNMSSRNQREEQAVELLKPFVKELCKRKWYNLEPEDREAEGFYMLAVALRKVSTDTGHFIEDYWALTKPYMDDLNRKTPSRYYPPCKSLDAPIGRNQDNWTLSDCISDKSVDDTILYVQSFISTLPKIDQFILHALMNNRSLSSISKELGISSAKLKGHVRSLGEKYLKDEWNG